MSSPSSPAADGPQPSGYQIDDLIVDVGRRSVSRGGVEVPFPALSFDLLLALIKAAPNLLSYDDLMAQVWQGIVVNSETITQRAKLVRDALGDDPHTPRYIAGVRGHGYRMLSPVMPITLRANAAATPAGAPPPDTSHWSRRRVAAIALAASLLAVAGGSWFALRSNHKAASERGAATSEIVIAAPKSIAVLAFVDMSEGKSQEYFADGMAEELLDTLAKIPQLTVIGRTSSFSFKGSNVDARVIGAKLGATHLVQGSVRRSGDHIRISVQLIDTHSGAQLWSSTYDRDFGDVLVIQGEIASAIARSLQLAVDADVAGDIRPLRNTEAYNFYLRGRAALDRGDATVAEAKTYFKQALVLDPTFAKAQEALAGAYADEIATGLIDVKAGWPAAVDAARRALQLDPKSAGAHSILGRERAAYEYDWRGANAELDQALALQPRDPDALSSIAWLALILGRHDEATRLQEAALAIDPLNPGSHQTSAWMNYYQRDLDGAEREFRASLQISPTYADSHFMLGLVLLLRGEPEAALKEVQAESMRKDIGLAFVYHALGREAESDAALERAKQFELAGACTIARMYAYRKEPDPAFEWLEKCVARREMPTVGRLKYDPMLDSLRKDPRYEAILRTVNLHDATRQGVGAAH